MDARIWIANVLLLVTGASAACAGEATDYRIEAAAACPQDAVDAHVLDQYRIYGPQSTEREFFGFIFSSNGELGSAVAAGKICGSHYECAVDSNTAVPLIPRGAKILGEWHTHPRRNGTDSLSADDVRGARNNLHIRCYASYYSQSNGDIYAWNPAETSVPGAMASRFLIGRYSAAIIAAHQDPGTTCLSTNTNVHTAATTKKCCRKSPTSRSPSAQAAGRRDCAS